ncbi:hypothetical protein NEFER03_2266 [Nematocida sp. LUAm3]|nr:hypothetical protein NEFER03_1915 [Nematocida sp. LUAm3]KAI5174799.1 hypothetical protein NEFER02_0909 [Nematocida sp. LUAm2]KAI5177022.1 hypothetical protein NEFER01_0347 [Nematocida sp. LUAm1]KAI5173355.1 hypothetical protein NEFER03_2266 [Nematocida sp. LUAm3]KAI5176183.1 hypothetical protein NEFER02_1997 [Nematocida sp. LUAm2]
MKNYAEKYFSDVKTHENAPWIFKGEPPAVPSFPIDGPPEKSYDTVFQEALSDKVVIQRPYDRNSKEHTLAVCLPLPAVFHSFKEQNLLFLLDFIMTMGIKKNIYSILEAKGVIISYDIHKLNNAESSFFKFTFSLPEASMESVSSLLSLIGEQLKITEKVVSESFYNEYKEDWEKLAKQLTISSIADLSLTLSSKRFFVPLEYIFNYNYVWDKYNPSRFQEFLKIAQDKSRWAVFLCTNDLFSEEVFQKEPILDVEYLVKQCSEKTDEHIDALFDMLLRNESIDFEVAYRDKKSLKFGTPIKNIFIPEDTTPEDYTVLEHIVPRYNGYYINKKSQKIGNVIGHIIINVPHMFDTIESYVSLIGHTKAFVEAFCKKYQEEIEKANASIDVSVTIDGELTIIFSCNPFNSCDFLTKFFTEYQKSPEYLGDSISIKAEEYFEDNEFEPVQATYIILQNALLKSKNMPFFQLYDCIDIASKIKAEDVIPVSKGKIKMYLIGNIYKEEFEEMNKIVTSFITPNEDSLAPKKPYLKHVSMNVRNLRSKIVAIAHHLETPFTYKSFLIASLISLMKNKEFGDIFGERNHDKYPVGVEDIITLE